MSPSLATRLASLPRLSSKETSQVMPAATAESVRQRLSLQCCHFAKVGDDIDSKRVGKRSPILSFRAVPLHRFPISWLHGVTVPMANRSNSASLRRGPRGVLVACLAKPAIQRRAGRPRRVAPQVSRCRPPPTSGAARAPRTAPFPAAHERL
jgi:hypothetical protein